MKLSVLSVDESVGDDRLSVSEVVDRLYPRRCTPAMSVVDEDDLCALAAAVGVMVR